ncbi:MAG: hypothetical protein CM15mP112_00120 [Flavobacteriales bacterium]|nr:MAG: hypothetical protein CM15mP112_00120 [Flavobacteriales bacterium]
MAKLYILMDKCIWGKTIMEKKWLGFLSGIMEISLLVHSKMGKKNGYAVKIEGKDF